MRSLANHGRHKHYSHALVGWNSRLDSLQATWLNLAYPHLAKRIESRRNAIQYYSKNLSNESKTFSQIKAPHSFKENAYLNALVFNSNEEREKIMERLKTHNISYAITYPSPISTQAGARPYMKTEAIGNAKQAQKISETILNLPLFPYISEEELSTVCKTVQDLTI